MPKNLRNMPVSRKRSCTNCRTAKTRCSLTFPTCTRCRSRLLDCVYEPQAPETGLNHSKCWNQAAMVHDTELSNAASGPEALQTVFSIRDEPQNISQRSSSNFGFSNRNGEQMDMSWNPKNADLRQTNSTVPGEKSSTMLDFSVVESNGGSGTSVLRQNSDFDNELQNFQGSSTAFETGILQEIMHESSFSDHQGSNIVTCTSGTNWPESMELPKSHPNLLNLKKLRTVGSTLNSKYLLSIIASYPSHMCEKTALPPFIHPRYPVKDRDCSCLSDKAPSELPECLAICASLAHMYQSRSPASIAYIWKTIAAEQERLYSEYFKYDKWKLLSALQAVTIYLIMQIGEEKHDNATAFMLVVTMGEISAKVFAENGYYCMSELNGNFPGWDDWVFAESCRRTMILLFIIERLLDINIDVTPPAACTGLDSVPLPCSEKLWKAETRVSWEATYKLYLEGRKGSPPLKYGTLRQSQQLETVALDKACLEDLETWCTGIDTLGTVVMIVARGI